MSKLLGYLNGWKTILSYVLMNIPGLTPYPMLLSALQELIANPTKQTLVNALIQGAMAFGVSHIVLKNLQKLTK